jgi:hypothetical protein
MGKPLWQEHDRMIGVPSPEDEKRIADQRQAHRDFADHSRSCDACWSFYAGYDGMMDEARMCDSGRELWKRSMPMTLAA